MRPISNTEQKRLALAIKIAEANTEYPNHRLGAVVVRGGSVLATGWNKFRNNPYVVENPRASGASYHAEEDVISRSGDASGAILYVARVTPGGREGLAMPCVRCSSQIAEAGIKRVVFTVNGSSPGETLTIAELVKFHEVNNKIRSSY